MKKFAMAFVCTLALVGFVTADEITGIISKVDSKAGTITFTKLGKFKKDDAPPPEAVTAKLAKGGRSSKASSI